MKKIITLLVVLSLAGTASAGVSNAGATGAQFLKIGVGSKYQGMGEASVANVNDVYSMYWNPAGLVEIQNMEIGFTNVNWLLDIDLNYIGFARYFEDVGVFGASAAILSMDDQEITTLDFQDGTGDYYSAHSYAINVSFARQLTGKFAFGASVKYIEEKIHLQYAKGYAFDFGTMLYTGFRSLRMGMSITNMGPSMKFEGPGLDIRYDPLGATGSNEPISAQLKTTPYDLPMTFKIGLAYDVDFNRNSILTIASELRHPSDHDRQGSIGMEYAYNEMFFLRSGYKLNYDEETLSFGGGLITKFTGDTRIKIDYSWQDFGRLESSQKISVGFLF